jgi:signal transduction histidine kinase
VAEPEALHPLTTRSSPLLPSRHAEGAVPDVWEELDRAAAWVCDRTAGAPGTDDVRHALRVLCIAVRAVAHGGEPPRSRDLPWNVDAAGLLSALRRRLLEQAVAPSGGAPAEVLRVLHAVERIEAVLRRDDARALVAQLSGAGSLELLVEMAHDMRSPLGSILFLVERLRGDAAAPPSEAQQRQLGLVYGAAFGLSTMVGDVMELARGGDRLAGGEPAPLFLGEVLDGVREIVQPIAEERGLTLEVCAPPSEARVGHAAGIQRVLLNLATNALKFTPQGTVTVRATALDRARVAFEVQDTGPGIPPRVVAQLFDAFRPRGGDGRDLAFSSAGLGLAICRKLVSTMGGELAVDTALGRGTRFRFELELPPAR